MASFLRFGVLLGVVPTLLLLGCGGKVGGDLEDTGPGDSSADAAPDTDLPPDGSPWVDGGPGPGGCGYGACTPGIGCFDGCNSCKCVAENLWECTDLHCPDADPPPPPPPPPCPYPLPGDRTYCPVEGQACEYKNSCGTVDYAYCTRGPDGSQVWITRSECSTSMCPASLPPYGAACTGFSRCGYANSCGGVDTASCNGKFWEVAKGPCTPPPPPPTCPTSTPPDGSACASGLSCNWNNGCGAINSGYCVGGAWSIKREPCAPACPAGKPAGGLFCSPPGTTMCRYVVSPGSTCTTQCFCSDDSRWACVTPPCAEPVPVDAGPGWP